MSLVPEVELKDILLSNSTFGPSEIEFISNRISNDFSQFPNLKEATQQLELQTERSPATSVKLGVCQYLTGHYSNAIETLQNADGGALALFYQGKCHYSLGGYEQAIAAYNSAQAAGYNGDLCQLAVSACHRQQKDIDGAMAILDNMFGPIEQTRG